MWIPQKQMKIFLFFSGIAVHGVHCAEKRLIKDGEYSDS